MLYLLTIFLSSLIASNLAANCCIDAPDENTCGDVASACVWIEDNAAAMAISQNIKCVSESWFQCEVNGVCPPPPPVPPVPSACVFNACENNQETYNIAFVIDESGSVGRTNYLISLDFIENMVRNDVNDVSPISMLAFASGLDRIYRFDQSQNDQRAGALAALHAERANYNSGGTCTATALREIATEYSDFATPQENNKLILMTDGYPNCGGDVCAEKAGLDAAGVEVFIVGVSGGFNPSRVSCLVDDSSKIISIPKFDSKLFYHIEAQLRRVVCPPDVFKKDVGKMLYEFVTLNGESSMGYMYIAGVIALIIAAFVYRFRAKICKKNEKYVALTENRPSQYQSV